MKGIVIEEQDIIKKLYRIGAIGELAQSVELHPLLAAYLAEKGAITDDNFLKKAKKSDKLAEDKLAILRHLWSRGYISRLSLEGEDFMRVHRKGIRPGEDRTQYLVKVIPSSWKPKFSEIMEAIEFAGRLRKELVFAFVEKPEKKPENKEKTNNENKDKVNEGRIQFVRLGRGTFE